MPIEIKVKQGDITKINTDVVVLKFAQAFYGADKAVAEAIWAPDGVQFLPETEEFTFIDTGGAIGAKKALFVHVIRLNQFNYSQIRDFSTEALKILRKEYPNCRNLAMTIHGVRFGLDEVECVLSQLGGLIDAIYANNFPPSLESIIFVEINPERVERIEKIVKKGLSFYIDYMGVEITKKVNIPARVQNVDAPTMDAEQKIYRIDQAGTTSGEKPHVFVSMSFTPEMDDVYHLAIFDVVKNEGYICERADLTPFTGDILERIKKRIDSATLVIADLTGSSPNVYLEVGYAWGRERPTLLLSNSKEDLKFDVQGQRIVIYKNIIHLREILAKELQHLLQNIND